MSGNQNYINHVALVLDGSSSMSHLSRKVVEVADQQIEFPLGPRCRHRLFR